MAMNDATDSSSNSNKDNKILFGPESITVDDRRWHFRGQMDDVGRTDTVSK